MNSVSSLRHLRKDFVDYPPKALFCEDSFILKHVLSVGIIGFCLCLQEFVGGWQNCEKRTLAESCLYVRMGQPCSHGTDCYEICYLRMCPIYIEENQVSLTSDKNNGHFT